MSHYSRDEIVSQNEHDFTAVNTKPREHISRNLPLIFALD